MLWTSQLTYQYLAGFIVNIISMAYGTIYGWPSASFLDLQADDSPLDTGPMTNTEVGWTGAVFYIGGMFGTLYFSWLSDQIGRKLSLMLMTIPAMISWIIIIIAQNPLHLYVSRFIGGTVGGVLAVLPIYVTEVSEVRVRGILGNLTIPSVNLGVLVTFILGNYFSYATIAIILGHIPIIFLIAFYAFPETPQFLIKKGKFGAAEESLHFYRNTSDHFSDEFRYELEQLKAQQSKGSAKISWEDFNNRAARKALFIGATLMLLNELSGTIALVNYAATIFQQSGSNLSPKVSAIIIAVIVLVGSYVSIFLVESAGRKILLIISSIGTGVGLLLLGSYDYLTVIGYDMQDFHWLRITSFGLSIFIACWGVEPLPFLIVAEIMPSKIRNVGCMLCVTLFWFIDFTTVLLFPTMTEYLGMHGVMFFFAGSSFLGTLFTIIFVPETKDKTLEEIQAML